jgi:hypothetical protein
MSDSMSQYCPNCEAQAAEIERLQATVGDRMEFYLDRIEAQAAEIERLREALRDAAEVIENCNVVFLHKWGTTNFWFNAVLAKARAALARKAEQ